MTSECIFCDIVSGHTETQILYETDDLVESRDIPASGSKAELAWDEKLERISVDQVEIFVGPARVVVLLPVDPGAPLPVAV